MELHDWAHAGVAALVSGGWGPRGFDRWRFDESSHVSISNGQQALATLAGPLVNFLAIALGWIKMSNQENLADQSLGCSLVLAALPMDMLKGAINGGGDLTIGLKLLFSHWDGIYHHLMSGIGILILLIVCIPPLVRLFMLLPSWSGRFIFFPLFLFAPMYVRHYVTHGLDDLLLKFEPDESRAYFWVFFWTIATFAGWFFTRHRLDRLLVDQELPL